MLTQPGHTTSQHARVLLERTIVSSSTVVPFPGVNLIGSRCFLPSERPAPHDQNQASSLDTAPEGWGRAHTLKRQEGGSGEFLGRYGAPRTFINETHILLMGWGKDLTAAGGRAGATVPLAVVDDSGDRGTGGAQHVRKGWGQSGPIPSPSGEATPPPRTHLVIAGVSGPCAPLPGPLSL